MGQIKPIIGLCGGIGAGKSVVASALAEAGGLVIDSDRLNHEVLGEPEVARTLRQWWGERVVGPDGGVDRQRVAEIVFDDAEQRRRLETFVHPLIARRRENIIRGANTDPTVRAIILDSPLLFESNLGRLCHAIVFVEASEALRLRRLKRTRGWDLGELRRRERWQMPLAEKRRRSQYVIRNEGSIEQLRSQAQDVFERALAEYSPDQ
jgi:dephospho-CoA kinase